MTAVPWICGLWHCRSRVSSPGRILALCMLLSAALAAQEISIQRDGRTFKVIGWTPGQNAPAEGGWAAVFSVYAGAGDVPPMLGSYAIEGGLLVFRPRFALG